jgi:hypothetical protein
MFACYVSVNLKLFISRVKTSHCTHTHTHTHIYIYIYISKTALKLDTCKQYENIFVYYCIELYYGCRNIYSNLPNIIIIIIIIVGLGFEVLSYVSQSLSDDPVPSIFFLCSL